MGSSLDENRDAGPYLVEVAELVVGATPGREHDDIDEVAPDVTVIEALALARLVPGRGLVVGALGIVSVLVPPRDVEAGEVLHRHGLAASLAPERAAVGDDERDVARIVCEVVGLEEVEDLVWVLGPVVGRTRRVLEPGGEALSELADLVARLDAITVRHGGR